MKSGVFVFYVVCPMESGNVSAATLKPLSEGSGYVTNYSKSTDAQTTPWIIATDDIKSGLGSTRDLPQRDAPTIAMKTHRPDLDDVMKDNTTLLQTNILLIAVLVVCFVTLISVVAMCGCFLRRYCKNRRITQSSTELYQTTLVTKATSITGLNVAHEYYSTKVEKKDEFSPTIIAENKCNKATECELGAEKISGGVPGMPSPTFNPASPVCHAPTEDAAPIYFKMKNVLTSTPASTEHLHVNGNLESVAPNCGVLSPVQRQNIVLSMASPPSIYTSALSNQQPVTQNAQLDSSTPGEAMFDCQVNGVAQMRCLVKGPATQSVSWFVPLNGVQREPLRHSIVDLFEDEVLGDVSVPSRRDGSAKFKKFTHNAPLKEEAETSGSTENPDDLRVQDLEDGPNDEVSEAENAPLMNNKTDAPMAPDAQSQLPKRSRLKSSMSENGEHGDSASATQLQSELRTRSLSSPDEKTMWKQREERPVLFLGADTK